MDLWFLLTYSEFDRSRSNSYSVLSRRKRHSFTCERRMRSFMVSTKNWSCWWNSSLLAPLDGLFCWAILFKKPDDSCFASYGFKIDVAWMLKGSSWSPATAAFCFWKPPLCLKDLKLYLLLWFYICFFWTPYALFFAFVITKSIFCPWLLSIWVGSLSSTSLTFLYWTSFRTLWRSFASSF